MLKEKCIDAKVIFAALLVYECPVFRSAATIISTCQNLYFLKV